MPKRSVVIGATGIVGGYIVDRLAKASETPVALSRTRLAETPGVESVEGDLAKPSGFELPPHATIYCTAYAGLLADALPDIYRPSLERVVAFTSTSIVTKIDSDIPAERQLAKRWLEAESRLIAACEKLDVKWTLLRPTIIYDEGRDANITRLSRIIDKLGFMPLAGSGAGLRQPVHAEDLAVGAIAAAGSDTAINKIYDLPGADTISYREMVGRIFDGMDRPRRIVSVPPLLWKTAFALAGPFIANANVAMGDRMSKDMAFDAVPAVQGFGWNPRGFRPRFK